MTNSGQAVFGSMKSLTSVRCSHSTSRFQNPSKPSEGVQTNAIQHGSCQKQSRNSQGESHISNPVLYSRIPGDHVHALGMPDVGGQVFGSL